nr:uncharacterized protein LOC129280476 [Lytechinus pictus]
MQRKNSVRQNLQRQRSLENITAGQYNSNENQYQSSGYGQQRPSSGHHQRTRSFSAGIRNSTITRDTKGHQGGSLAVSSSRLVPAQRPISAKAGRPTPGVSSSDQEHWLLGAPRTTFGSYSQAHGTISASSLAKLQGR